jgi:AraC-like DNA-binding protein
VTTDQGHSSISESRSSAALYEARAGCVDESNLRMHARIDVVDSATEQLFSSAHEDISRLTDILRGQQCAASVRGCDGVIVALDTSASRSAGGCGSDVNCPAAITQCAPIYNSDGRAFASLEIVHGADVASDSSAKLFRSLIESAARSMTERWFRITHRRHWIVAALRRHSPHTCIILAVDRDQRLLAIDREARQLLERQGRRFEKRLPLSAFFESNPTLFRHRGYGDTFATLRQSSGGEPWIALVTPPDIGVAGTDRDTGSMLHARPRLDCLKRLLLVAPDGAEQRGLSGGSLQRIGKYIQANLGSALDIDELAALVRMSPSHFTRSFHKSVGMTPHRYVIQCRVTKARELLSATQLPLTEIALTTGFSDQSHFSRRFQEVVGVPPGAYRRSEGRPLR